MTTWWLNQPVWKICKSQIGSFPQIGLNITNMWNHHLMILGGWIISGWRWMDMWLSSMVLINTSPIRIGLWGFPSKWPKFMAYKWGVILTTYDTWDDPHWSSKIPPRSLSVRPWKMVVRRLSFPIGSLRNFSGTFAVKLREGSRFSMPNLQSK